VTTEAYIAIGSNLGDRQATIDSAIIELGSHNTIEIVAHSSIIETPPVGEIEQGPYLNGVIHARTTLNARELLDALLAIETTHGRDRSTEQRWGPRTLDLDLILFGDEVIDEPGLQVPHPRLHERTFVLIPLTQIAPDLVIPVQNETPRQLLKALGGAG
jgi:2-amino-4-hydroxy-6-hydroxymethyldihydropteridine diphosphokinase